jgi:hypothetical protein
MKTVVMRRTDREKKDMVDGFAAPFRPGGEDYPYGLRITLDDGSLKKLGIKDMPKPGDRFRLEAVAHVLESAQRTTEDDSDRRVELVLHELGAEPAGGSADEKDKDKTLREELEDARHQARGTTTHSIGRRAVAAR